jgi:hypothetical protein
MTWEGMLFEVRRSCATRIPPGNESLRRTRLSCIGQALLSISGARYRYDLGGKNGLHLCMAFISLRDFFF